MSKARRREQVGEANPPSSSRPSSGGAEAARPAGGAQVVPAREASGELLELLVEMRRALKARGESLPATWPEEAKEELRAGRMLGWALLGPSDRRGLAILALREDRGFAQVHLGSPPEQVADGALLLRALQAGRPPALRRMEVAIAAGDAATEEAWTRALEAPGGTEGFSLLHRRAMVRSLDPNDPPAPTPLPEGFRFAPAPALGAPLLAAVDHAAFLGGPDEGLVAESPQDNERLLRGLLEGDLGAPLREASPALLQEEAGAAGPTGHLVGFALALEESPRAALLADLAVHPKFRGRGLGRALLTRSLRGLIALGFQEVRLWVTEGNLAAIALYSRSGFQVERRSLILRWAATVP